MPVDQAQLLTKISSYSYSQIQELAITETIVQEIRVAFAILKGEKDVICVARTGAGKSLTFYIPLVLRMDGIVIIVVPLNALATEMASHLSSIGLPAIALTAKESNEANFKDIAQHKYRVVITNPETMLEKNGRFLKLLKERSFQLKLIAVIIDEVHCVINWGEFRPEYRELGLLRYVIPASVPLYLVSATLPPTVTRDIQRLLRLRPDPYEEILSNDRPNVAIMVRRIAYPLESFWDLSFLIPDGWTDKEDKPMLFLVMFDSINVLHQALDFLRGRLSREYRRMVLPFHSEMSEEHRLRTIAQMKKGDILGVCASEGFGLGIDVPRIELVVQWRANSVDFCTLTQRFGRAARDPDVQGIGLLLVDPAFLDEEEEDINGGRPKKKRKGKQGPGGVRSKRARLPQSQGGSGLQDTSCREETQTDSQGGTQEGATSSYPSVDEEEGDIDTAGGIVSSVSNEGNVTENLPKLQARWDEYVAWWAGQRFSGKKKSSSGIEPALKDLINGVTPELKCRRIPGRVFFSRSRALASIITASVPTSPCRSLEEGPCPRCQPPPPQNCCDRHSPELLRKLPPVEPHDFPRKTRRSNLPARARMDGVTEARLTQALREWRERAALEWLGSEHQDIHGRAAVMPDSVLKHIVMYASVGKITSVDSLKRESHWSRTRKYGAEVLEIVFKYYPLHLEDPVPANHIPSGPLRDFTAPFVNYGINTYPAVSNGPQEAPVDPPALAQALVPVPSSSKRQKKGHNKCSLCGSPDHIKSKRCPLYEDFKANKENTR